MDKKIYILSDDKGEIFDCQEFTAEEYKNAQWLIITGSEVGSASWKDQTPYSQGVCGHVVWQAEEIRRLRKQLRLNMVICAGCLQEFNDGRAVCCGAKGEASYCNMCCPQHKPHFETEDDQISSYESEMIRRENESLASYYEGLENE